MFGKNKNYRTSIDVVVILSGFLCESNKKEEKDWGLLVPHEVSEYRERMGESFK
jgi:hypothetical protein